MKRYFLTKSKMKLNYELNKEWTELSKFEANNLPKKISTKKEYDKLIKELNKKALVKKAYLLSDNYKECINLFNPRSYKYNKFDEKKEELKLKVNVKDPDWILFEEKILIWQNKERFEKRKNQHRIIKKPITIHPRLARAMINIASPKKEVLDPFCGTGGILLEAGLLGYNCIGYDISPEMINASKINLSEYNLSPSIFLKDVMKCEELSFETIVCDPPYLKNSSSNFKSKVLIEKMLFISKAKRICMCIDNKIRFNIPSKYSLIFETQIKVHKSMTRKIVLLELC